MRKKILIKLQKLLNSLFGYLIEPNETNLIRNINYKNSVDQPKVLISYITCGFYKDLDKGFGRTHIYENFKIIEVFEKLGFAVDIAHCNSTELLNDIGKIEYEVIFGFGEVFFQMAQNLKNAITILYMTEHHPRFSIQEEQKRIDYFYKRHNKISKNPRSENFYKIKHLDREYSAIITMSETEPFNIKKDKLFTLYPTGIINDNFYFKEKDHFQGRKNFLWLGTSGTSIHKGLDLLLDIFSDRKDVILHICGLNDRDRKFLNIQKVTNIIDYGYINIKSDLFLKLVDKCSFIILPSCSEGFSTAITTGMLHGLIPVVMQGTGFNRLADKAIFLNDYDIKYMDNEISKMTNMDTDYLLKFSNKVFDFARENFVINKYYENIKSIIFNIVKKNYNK
jgi:hypothetical protein